jgi:N,N'-diacetyllegionaminate synthase
MSTIVPALAVAIGASVIEKHYTLSKRLPGPDHPFALEPQELIEMIYNIRLAENTLKYRSNEYTYSEQSFANARRSIVAKTFIKKGEYFTIDNITTKRPFLEGCIPAMDYENILGKIADKDYSEDSFI